MRLLTLDPKSFETGHDSDKRRRRWMRKVMGGVADILSRGGEGERERTSLF
jgi:hypothetical protein